MRKTIIKGCDSRGDGEEPYLTRWDIFRRKHLHIYLHKFHRSDSQELHDRPWNFISIILWRGYIEETFVKPPQLHPVKKFIFYDKVIPEKSSYTALYLQQKKTIDDLGRKRKRIYPGQIIFRRATHAHRVELLNNKPAYTLLINFGYVRQWGFFTKNYWQHFVSYFNDNQCNKAEVIE